MEAILKENYDNDYDEVLKIYPKIDTALAATYQESIDDAIKKSSIAIQRHKNSRWVDDSYIFIGRARFYSLDYVNAIETYKYVNTNSEDDNARHEALARLLRTFVDYQEFENAVAVEDYIKKEKLNKKNQKLLYLNKAHHNQALEDYDKMVENLVKAAPLLKKKDGRGRIYFIIAQIYQRLGFDGEAFNYYKKCLSSHPEYELDFFTRLNMAQVTELGKSSDVKSARKLLQSLLKDSKNKEFQDKIYYELGQFEFKQNNIDEAIENYKLSVQNSISNPRQKGRSFLKLGEVYYDSVNNYELAQAYYDSAVQSLPSDYDGIESIKQRQEILALFVKQLKTIELQDSLLQLASLDSIAISEKLTAIIEDEQSKIRAEAEKAERKKRKTQFNAQNNRTGIESTGWYFGNPSAVAQGQSEFISIWGNRPLGDNWRLSNKSRAQNFTDTNKNNALTNINDEAPADTLNEDSRGTSQYDEMYSKIPFSVEDKKQSLDQIEEALYKLGNIYKYSLEEDLNAALAFEQLINRFSETPYKAEVLYNLYLIYKGLGDDKYLKYKDLLLKEYSNTVYAKLIINPNYREESTAANEKLKLVYKKSYEHYNIGEYDTSLNIINDALAQFDEVAFTGNMELLKILIIGKTEDISLYQYELSQFIKKYPDHELNSYAQKLLDASNVFQERKRKRLGTQYVNYLEQSHYYVFIYETKSSITELAVESIEKFNALKNYTELKVSNLILDENYAMILVSDFKDKREAINYYEEFLSNDPIDEQKRNSKFYKFVITKDNFNIFYQSKDFETYLVFFQKNYLDGIN